MSSLAVIHSHWHHHFDNMQLSVNEFYSEIQEKIKTYQFPNVSSKRISQSEGGLLSANREYLRIARNEYAFDICAAPFGKSFFISWWLGEKGSAMVDLLARIPFIGGFLARKAQQRTYYQMDTETMFKESVNAIIQNVIDKVTQEKGVRQLAPEERIFKDYNTK